MSTFKVAFENIELTIEARDIADAQEKAIDLLESAGITHGAILSIKRA